MPGQPQEEEDDLRPDAEAGARAAAETTGRSVLAGGSWNALALLAPQLLVLVVSVSAARFLGPDQLGRQSFIAFVEITVISIGTLGLPVALMRTVASAVGEGRAAQTRGLLAWAWRMMAAAAVVGGLVVASGAVLSDRDSASWLLAGTVAFTGILQTVPGAVLLGLQRWRQATTAGLVTSGGDAIAVIALLAAGGGIVDIFLVQAVVGTINLLWTGALARRALDEVAPTSRPAGTLKADTLRFARPNAALAVLDTIVWKRSEFFFLVRYSDSSEIAQYSIAYAAMNALAQVPAAVTNLASSFATLHSAGEHERLRSGFSRGCRLLLVLTLPLTAGMAAMGPGLVTLVYGDDYDRATKVLLLLLIALPLLPLATLSDALLVGQGTVTWPLRALAAAVPVNLVLAALLVPPYGAVGAAIASVTSQVVAGLPIIVVVFRQVGLRRSDFALQMLVRNAAVAASAGVLAHTVEVALDGVLGLVLGIATFAVAWLLLALTCRILPASDGWWLGETLETRLGPKAPLVVHALTERP